MTEELYKMLSELNEIQDYLLIEPSGGVEELKERLSALNVYLARCNKIWADATHILLKEKEELFTKYDLLNCSSRSLAKELLTAKTADAGYVCKLAERISRTIVHNGDNLRTSISFDKEEMKLTRTGY